jgi:hypothetical protein
MAFNLKPRLSGENSIIASLSTVALVMGIYAMKVGPISDVHATDVMDGNMAASVKKAGIEAVAVVAGVTLLAKDPNIAILGGATIIAEELFYRHALMADPANGQINVAPSAYQPAGSGGSNVTAMPVAAAAGY